MSLYSYPRQSRSGCGKVVFRSAKERPFAERKATLRLFQPPTGIILARATYSSLNEKHRRRYAAVEATKLGRGGHCRIVDLLGCDHKTIRRGFEDLKDPPDLRDFRVSRECRRVAFTLTEVLVVISIIGMLMALLLPAAMQAREAARRNQCANNLRNVGLAVQGEMNAKKRLPASGNFSTKGVPFHDWVVNVLPYIERSDILAQWRFDQPSNQPPNSPLAATHLEVLVCPDDNAAQNGDAKINYLANGGFGWTMPVDCPSVGSPSAGSGAGNIQPFDYNGNGVTCPTNPAQDNSRGNTCGNCTTAKRCFGPSPCSRSSIVAR